MGFDSGVEMHYRVELPVVAPLPLAEPLAVVLAELPLRLLLLSLSDI